MGQQQQNQEGDFSPLKPGTSDGALDPLQNITINGRYQIEHKIGYGGWSLVYKGTDLTLQRPVAIKMLHLPLAGDPDKLRRFQLEATAVSKLVHPNIATVFDYGVLASGQPYLIMEYLPGESLAEKLGRSRRLSAEEAISVFSAICDALSFAHDHGIVHRDVKPDNILLCQSTSSTGTGAVKLLDFGIAKIFQKETGQTLTATGETLGSPPYMSPEQCMGNSLDGRSDIYSLSRTLYEALCGERAFDGSAIECLHKHVAQLAPDLKEVEGFPNQAVVQKLVHKGLSKAPEDRFQTAQEMREALIAASSGKMAFKPVYVPTEKRRLVAVAVAAALSMAALFAALYLASSNLQPKSKLDPASEAQRVLSSLKVSSPSVAQSIERQLTSERLTQKSEHGAGIIFGRITNAEGDLEPRQITSQVMFAPNGYYVEAVLNYSDPVEFVAHGYEPALVDLKSLPLKGDFVWVGKTVLQPVSPDRQATVSGKLTWPTNIDPTNLEVSLSPQISHFNSSSHHPNHTYTTFPVNKDGTFSVHNCSPIKYNVSFDADNLTMQRQTITLSPGQTLDLGTLQLVAAPKIHAEFKFSTTPDFTHAPLQQKDVYSEQTFGAFPEQLTDEALIVLAKGKKLSVLSPEMTVADLGSSQSLAFHSPINVGETHFGTSFDMSFDYGHCYLMRYVGEKQEGWLLIRFSLLPPA
jgi:serine/threonine protein kinase